MRKRSVRDLDVDGRRVFVRVDFNVPLTPDGQVADDGRIRASLPTIRYLIDHGAKTVLGSHLGRPQGVDESLRLAPVVRVLEAALDGPVRYVQDCVGPEVEAAVAAMQPGDVLLLENLRFHPEEEANDPGFVHQLAALADLYVNDAFGTAHRAHASTEGIAHLLPSAAGFLMEKEIEFLSKAVEDPERPYAAVIGGAKVSSKLQILHSLLDRVDRLLIGGGMANTFVKAEGYDVGASRVEDDLLDDARRILEEAERRNVKIVLPADFVIADKFDPNARTMIVSVKGIHKGWQALDIGPMTAKLFERSLQGCRTVVWNGPMGVFELQPFAQGSYAIARAIAALPECTTIVGGGETAQLVDEMGLSFSHVSTGGGAALEFLEGRELPGIAALPDA